MSRAILLIVTIIVCILSVRHISDYYKQQYDEAHKQSKLSNVNAKEQHKPIYITPPISETVKHE